MKQLERLLFLQGNRCFFCDGAIPEGEASVEHLVATANGGANHDDNCVVCCRSLNLALGSLSIKAKIQAILRHRGRFVCPRTATTPGTPVALRVVPLPPTAERLQRVVTSLRKQGQARPRRVATLRTAVNQIFQKTLTDAELIALIDALKDRGYVSVESDQVAYALPKAD